MTEKISSDWFVSVRISVTQTDIAVDLPATEDIMFVVKAQQFASR